MIRKNDSAFKRPFYETIDDIKFERSIYEKLDRHSRVTEYRDFRGKRIELKFYEKGDMNGKISDQEFTILLIKWAD